MGRKASLKKKQPFLTKVLSKTYNVSEEKLRMYLTAADVISSEGPRAEKICTGQTPVL